MKKIIALLVILYSLDIFSQKRFSDLPEATGIQSVDIIPIMQNDTTKRVAYLVIKNAIATQIHDSVVNKLGKTETAANSNLLQGKDSVYIKANWGGSNIYANSGLRKDGDTIKLGDVNLYGYNQPVIVIDTFIQIIDTATGAGISFANKPSYARYIDLNVPNQQGFTSGKLTVFPEAIDIYVPNNQTLVDTNAWYFGGNAVTANASITSDGVITADTFKAYSVVATSTNSTAIHGTSNNAIGVFGESQENYGGYFRSTNTEGLRGESTNEPAIAGMVFNSKKIASFQTNEMGEKSYVDSSGYYRGNSPHAISQFMDSTITISLTQNVWVQITNTWKNLWPSDEFVSFTESYDTIITSIKGDFIYNNEVNLLGIDSKDYEYRIMRRRNNVSSAIWHYKISSSGKAVLREINSYIKDALIGDRYWIELRSTSSTPGNVTIYGGRMRFTTLHLDLE